MVLRRQNVSPEEDQRIYDQYVNILVGTLIRRVNAEAADDTVGDLDPQPAADTTADRGLGIDVEEAEE
jgi:hypothetical protein